MSEQSRKYKEFTDFLNDKFYAENPTTLDDEWPDLYSDWLSDQDSDTLVKYADEYAEALKKRESRLRSLFNSIYPDFITDQGKRLFGEAITAALSEGGIH